MNGSLPPQERELAEQHIAICEGCRLELELVRAIGSQEKPPAAAKDDWTLDRIFGAEGPQGKGAEPGPSAAPPSAPPQPAPPEPVAPAPPARVPHPALPGGPLFGTSASEAKPETPASSQTSDSSGSSEDDKEESAFGGKSASGATTSWDFEPTDAKSEGSPPEESLFFATEALTRRKDPTSKKGSGAHLLLWGAGGLIGAILLAFSSWFVLHMGSPDAQDTQTGVEAPTDSFPGDPGDQSPDDPGTPDPSFDPNDGGIMQPGGSSELPDQTARTQAPRVTASSSVPSPPIAAGARTPTPTITPKATPEPSTTPTRSTPPPAARVTPPPPRQTAGSQRATDGSVRIVPEPVKAPTRTVARPPEEEDDMIPDAFVGPDPDDPGDRPVPEPAKAATGTKPGTSGYHQRVTPPQTVKAPEPEPAPAPAPDNSPIGLLHLATVTAEQEEDLPELRRLRSEWKSFMSKIVGPDRARAKREYADCLWAIQVLTGRRSDQKDALAAYREYLLGAPAGGADSRTVSRLRQLEDALTPNR